MRFGSALRCLLAVCAIGLHAPAHAQTTPAAAASGVEAACESGTFGKTGTFVVEPGLKVPPEGVIVRLVLQFSEPMVEPEVTVGFNSGDPAFADAAIAVAKAQRLACAQRGKQPLRYTQELQFVDGEVPKGVVWPIRSINERRAADGDATCFKSADGRPRFPNKLPWNGLVPGSNLAALPPDDVQPKTIIAKLEFSGPNVAPKATILFSRGGKRFDAAVLDYVAEHRWSCMKAGDPPVEAVQVFNYVFDGHEPTPVALTLQQFLGAVDKVSEKKAYFDFRTMGCPFSMRMTYLQPFMSNEVVEVGDANPN
ncbi:MAG: hypothetical protein IAE86_00805, partial [Burkholderiaceae bacterium]|nr:hypothetical protein [Burkholderiaceae bacterium]